MNKIKERIKRLKEKYKGKDKNIYSSGNKFTEEDCPKLIINIDPKVIEKLK